MDENKVETENEMDFKDLDAFEDDFGKQLEKLISKKTQSIKNDLLSQTKDTIKGTLTERETEAVFNEFHRQNLDFDTAR
jgi:hypothetical protein